MSRIPAHQHWPIPRKVWLEGRTDELEQICANQTQIISDLRKKIEELSNTVWDANTYRFVYIGR